MSEPLVHVYLEPPVPGSKALCGYVRDDTLWPIISDDKHCIVCQEIAQARGMIQIAVRTDGNWYRENLKQDQSPNPHLGPIDD